MLLVLLLRCSHALCVHTQQVGWWGHASRAVLVGGAPCYNMQGCPQVIHGQSGLLYVENGADALSLCHAMPTGAERHAQIAVHGCGCQLLWLVLVSGWSMRAPLTRCMITIHAVGLTYSFCVVAVGHSPVCLGVIR
jgi:hypothetical protein